MDTKEIIKTYSDLIHERERLEINQIESLYLPKSTYKYCLFLFILYFIMSFNLTDESNIFILSLSFLILFLSPLFDLIFTVNNFFEIRDHNEKSFHPKKLLKNKSFYTQSISLLIFNICHFFLYFFLIFVNDHFNFIVSDKHAYLSFLVFSAGYFSLIYFIQGRFMEVIVNKVMPTKALNDIEIRKNQAKITELTNIIMNSEEILLEMSNSKDEVVVEFINNISYEDLVKDKVENKVESIQNY
ncbi:MAG: hypothetical protein CL760_10170 [Chloroflexi bacterium]|nr:hypothetical protein [Chloroflexota bacterium]|tara:strand:+ start:13349 stop:14077 length:729 start_codon:yes stop_codon:yes gene_type:complete